MNTSAPPGRSRLDREVEREQDERHKHDDAKTGFAQEEDFRVKDARDSSHSGNLHRSRGR